MEKLIMNKREREQLVVFKKIASKELSKKAGAAVLGITDRWLRIKFGRYKDKGDAGLVHGNRGRVSPNKYSAEDSQLLIGLLREEWVKFGPTFAAEKMQELHGKKMSRETARAIMKAHGIEYGTRKRKKTRMRRERKEFFGQMVQLDGSHHDWFEGRAPKCCLLVFIDDATSQILWLQFADRESYSSVMGAAKSYFEKHGIPGSFYTDYGSVFSVNNNNKERVKITQFERALSELSTEIIHARSPQAKGRVERCNKTMQDRLVKEMRLAKVSSIEEGNKFLKESGFIDKHNTKYACPPAKGGNVHKSIVEYDLHNILCTKDTRIVTNDYTFSYQNKIIQLTDNLTVLLRPKDIVVVHEYIDQTIGVFLRGKPLQFKEIGQKKKRLKPTDHVLMDQEELGHGLSQSEQSETPLEKFYQNYHNELALQAMAIQPNGGY